MEHLIASSIAAKPIFVLTSSQSTPAADEFAYALKTHQWATIVGEVGSNSSRAGSPRAPANSALPVVYPDVDVNAADALPAAEKLALAALHRN